MSQASSRSGKLESYYGAEPLRKQRSPMSNSESEAFAIAAVDRQAIGTFEAPWRDYLGIAASLACAIHCAVMPLVIGFLPMLGLGFLADDAFHKLMACACFLIAVTAFVPGWRKHGSWLPVSVGAIGLCLVTAAAFLFADSCCLSGGSLRAQAAGIEDLSGSPHVCTESCCHPVDLPVAPQGEQVALVKQSLSEETPSPSTSLFSRFVIGLLTPLGGLLLVAGHVLNHRLACRCDCCSKAQ